MVHSAGLAPLITPATHADTLWVGIYYGLAGVAALLGHLGWGGFIIRHSAIRMS